MSYSITKDDYFKASRPSRYADVKNIVTCPYYTTAVLAAAEVGSGGGQDFFLGRYALGVPDATMVIDFGDKSPVIERDIESWNDPTIAIECYQDNDDRTVISPATPITVVSSTYYPSKAIIVLRNTNAYALYAKVTVTGHQVQFTKGESTSSDSASIVSNGSRKYTVKDNKLIQSPARSAQIAAGLLESQKDPRNDISIDWRGDPALEVGDEIDATIYASQVAGFVVTKQNIEYDGTIRATLEGIRTNKVFWVKTFSSGDGYTKTLDSSDTLIQKVL